MAKHSFFGGSLPNPLNNAPIKNAGYNTFGVFDSAEATSRYITGSNGIACDIDTPNVVNVGAASNVPINNQKAGSGIAMGLDGALATTMAASFMGGVNDGANLAGSGNRFYMIGCINYNNYNLATTDAENKIPGNNVDGFYSVDTSFAQYETAGDVGGGASDYTVCLLSNNKNGQSDTDRQGTRITFRFANGSLGAGLSALAYYGTTSIDFGLQITSLMNDENAAGRWLALGYGLLQGAEPAFWDAAN